MTDGTDNRELDIRTEDDKEEDEELEALFEEYRRQKDGDGPMDDNLRDLAEKHENQSADTTPDSDTMTDDTTPDSTSTDSSDPETGETTVRISDEVDPEDADFGPESEPDPEVAEEVAPDEKQKARRRAELQEAGLLDEDGNPTNKSGDLTVTDDEDDGDDVEGGRYGIDVSGENGESAPNVEVENDDVDVEVDPPEGHSAATDAADDAASEPAPEPDADVDAEQAVEDMASYDDVRDQMALEEVDPSELPDDFDIEDQDLEDDNGLPDARLVKLDRDEKDDIIIKLRALDQDTQVNVLERLQRTDSFNDRISVVVEAAVAAPQALPREQEDWGLDLRMRLFNECARQLGLERLMDFQ